MKKVLFVQLCLYIGAIGVFGTSNNEISEQKLKCNSGKSDSGKLIEKIDPKFHVILTYESTLIIKQNFPNDTKHHIETTAAEELNRILQNLTKIDQSIFDTLKMKNSSELKPHIKSLELIDEMTIPKKLELFKNISNLTQIPEITEEHKQLLAYLSTTPKYDDFTNITNEASNKAVELLCWKLFLSQAQTFLSSYEVQENIEQYKNFSDLENVIKNISQPLCVRVLTSEYFIPNESFEKEFTAIYNDAIFSPPIKLSSNTLTIQRNFATTSSIKSEIEKNHGQIETINVFVAGILYVDSDLDVIGLNLNIFALTWEIRKLSTFRLKGVDRMAQMSASGEMGLNSGNFYGWANKIINSNSLNVELLGGRGGDAMKTKDITVTHKYKIDHDSKKITLEYQPEDSQIESLNVTSIDENGSMIRIDLNETDPHKSIEHLLEKKIEYSMKMVPTSCCAHQNVLGGRGGEPGICAFKIESQNDFGEPKCIREKGADGERSCQTTGLISTTTGIYKGHDDKRIITKAVESNTVKEEPVECGTEAIEEVDFNQDKNEFEKSVEEISEQFKQFLQNWNNRE